MVPTAKVFQVACTGYLEDPLAVQVPRPLFLDMLQSREAFIEVFAEILVEPDSGRYGAFLLAH